MKAALIVNPVAGQGRSLKVMLKAQIKLGKAGFKLLTYKTEKSGDATLFARKAEEDLCRLVVVVGGDGTISEVINGIAETDTALGIIPAGTADVFARELKIPTHNVSKAIEVILKGKKTQIDLGKASGKYFVLMAGIGFDAQIVSEVKPEVKKLLKDLAYPLTGLKTLLTYKPSLLRIEVDGKTELEGYFVVVGNAKHYAGRFSITKKASISDGFLDVCVFKKGSTASFVKYIQGVITGTHLGFSDVEYLRAKDIFVSSGMAAFVQADGELIGKTPMHFTALPKALTVITP